MEQWDWTTKPWGHLKWGRVETTVHEADERIQVREYRSAYLYLTIQDRHLVELTSQHTRNMNEGDKTP
jgi:hypothetical protein